MKISVVRYDAQGGLAPRAATASKAPVVYEEPYADRHKVAILGTNFGKTLASGSPCPMVLFVQSIDGAPVTQTMRGWVKLLPGRHKVELGCRSTDTRVSCSLRRPFSKDIVVAAGRTYYFRGTVNGTFSKTRGGKALSSEEISKLDAFNENPVVRDAALWKLASQNVALEMKDGRFFAPKNLASVTLVVETTR